MRKLLFILLAILLLPCCVHQPQNGVRSLLKEAEGMIRTSPDTAYFLLREMETTMDLETEADSAYHGLLLMEAQTKNGMKLTDTTRLQSLIHYCQEQQDSLMQVRLLRLRALVHRDGGRYEKAVKCYNIVIDKAKRIDEKRWLADMYQELAHLHYSGFLILDADSCKLLSDSLFGMTAQLAKELGDSVLWMKSLITPITVARHRVGMMDYEQQLLQALDLAVALKDSATESDISMFLSMVYGEIGDKEKVLPYVRRSLSLRKGSASEAVSCIALGNAYQRIGMQDSATYYLEKGKELREKGNFVKYSEKFSDKGMVSNMKMHIERLKQKEALGNQQIYKRNMYVVVLMIVLVVVIIWAVYKIRKLHAQHQTEERVRKISEELCATLEDEKKRLAEKVASVKMQLHQQEADLYRHKEELRTQRNMLMQKEQEIKTLQLQLDKLSSDTIHLFDKIKQIISDFCTKNYSMFKMEETDWLQLQRVMDKRWNGAIGRIQNKYLLSDTEVRLLCLHLTDIPTSNLSFLFDRSRDFVYTNTRDLFVKLGVERGKRTYKKVLENFIENQG